MISPAPPAFDQCLRGLRQRLEAHGVKITGMALGDSDELRIGCRQPRAEIVLEDAADTAPAGPSEPFGTFRLVLVHCRRVDTAARELPALFAECLEEEWTNGLSHWLHRDTLPDDVEHSAEGLSRLLARKLQPGAPFWGTWRLERVEMEGDRFVVTLAGEPGQVRLALGGEANGSCLQTSLGPLHEIGEVPPEAEGLGPVRSVVWFLLRRLLHDGMRWVPPAPPPADTRCNQIDSASAAATPEGETTPPEPTLEEQAAVEPQRLQDELPGLFRYCLGSGQYKTGAAEVELSRFFDTWGPLDAAGLSSIFEDIRRGVVVLHANHDCAMAYGALTRCFTAGQTRWDDSWPNAEISLDRVLVTGLDDLAAVTGGESRLDGALAHWASSHPHRHVLVFSSCEYHLMGDNVPAICGKWADEGRGSISAVPPHVPGFLGLEELDFWHRFLDSCDSEPPPRQDGLPSVNLVGYAAYDTATIRHLKELLKELGVAVEAVVMPYYSPDAHRCFMRATLTLLSPGEPVPALFGDQLRRRGLRAASVTLPFGVAGTWRWLDEVAAELGLPPIDADRRREWAESGAPGLALYQRRVRERRLRAAICFDTGTIQDLLSPRTFFGLDLLEIFTESGCELTLVALPRVPEDERHDPEVVAALELQNVRFLTHPIGAEVDDVLRHERFDIVYCDVADGALVKLHGCLPMNIRNFRMGLEGALHNARYFATSGTFSLYRNYYRHLPKAPVSGVGDGDAT